MTEITNIALCNKRLYKLEDIIEKLEINIDKICVWSLLTEGFVYYIISQNDIDKRRRILEYYFINPEEIFYKYPLIYAFDGKNIRELFKALEILKIPSSYFEKYPYITFTLLYLNRRKIEDYLSGRTRILLFEESFRSYIFYLLTREIYEISKKSKGELVTIAGRRLQKYNRFPYLIRKYFKEYPHSLPRYLSLLMEIINKIDYICRKEERDGTYICNREKLKEISKYIVNNF